MTAQKIWGFYEELGSKFPELRIYNGSRSENDRTQAQSSKFSYRLQRVYY